MIPSALSIEVQTIVDVLADAPAGGTIKFAQISDAIGRDVLMNRHLIVSARRVAQRDHGIVFFTERKVGLRRLKVEEMGAIGATARSRVRSSARRGKASIQAVMNGANDIPPEVRQRAYTDLSVLGVVEHLSRESAVKKIEATPINKPMTVVETSRRFLETIGAIPKEAP